MNQRLPVIDSPRSAASILDPMNTHPHARPSSSAAPARPAAASSSACKPASCRCASARAAGTPPFDWEDRSTWAPALDGVGAVYLSYYPDIAVPGAVEAVGEFAALAVRSGARRIVLLSGRGEPEAERAEQAVRDTGAELTVLRATWFMQNFSEDYMLDHVLSGEIRLPAGDVPTPFLDIDDLADIAVAALTDDRHIGRTLRADRPATR